MAILTFKDTLIVWPTKSILVHDAITMAEDNIDLFQLQVAITQRWYNGRLALSTVTSLPLTLSTPAIPILTEGELELQP